MTSRVEQAIVLLVHPCQVDVCSRISIRLDARGLKSLTRAIAITEREPAYSDIHRQVRQGGVQRRGRLECLKRVLMPVIALQYEPSQLMPQCLAFRHLCKSICNRVGARVAASRVCTPERKQHGRLVGCRLG